MPQKDFFSLYRNLGRASIPSQRSRNEKVSKVMKPLHSVKTDIMEILYRQANLASSKEMPTAYITFTDSGQSLPVMTSYISFAVSSKTRL